MPTFLRGLCPSCHTSIETTVERPDERVECLRCGRQLSVSEAAEYRAQRRARRRTIWIVVVSVVVLVLAFLAYHYRASLRSAFDTVVTETGGKKAAWTCLSIGLVGLISLLMWMFLPIALYVALKDLRHRTDGLEAAQRAWARHMARLNRPDRSSSDQERRPPLG
jgi:hypothetical protein